MENPVNRFGYLSSTVMVSSTGISLVCCIWQCPTLWAALLDQPVSCRKSFTPITMHKEALSP